MMFEERRAIRYIILQDTSQGRCMGSGKMKIYVHEKVKVYYGNTNSQNARHDLWVSLRVGLDPYNNRLDEIFY